LELHFKPYPKGFKRNILRVAPDLLPPGRVRLDQVWIDDDEYDNFDKEAMTVRLPNTDKQVHVKVRLVPNV
jgi:hypothetical protein